MSRGEGEGGGGEEGGGGGGGEGGGGSGKEVEILLETVPYSPQSYSLKELRILLLQLRG